MQVNSTGELKRTIKTIVLVSLIKVYNKCQQIARPFQFSQETIRNEFYLSFVELKKKLRAQERKTKQKKREKKKKGRKQRTW